LKIDTKGADAIVLRGASGLLSRRLIDHVFFEYNTPWLHFGEALGPALRRLESFGYSCGLLGVGGLVPLSGGWWFDNRASSKTRMFSNVWCAAEQAIFVKLTVGYSARGPLAQLDVGLLEYGLEQPGPSR